MKKSLYLMVLVVLGFSSSAYASWQYGGRGAVTHITPYNGWSEIRFDIANVVNPLNCSVNDGKYAVVLTNDTNPDELEILGEEQATALLLASAISGTPEFNIYISREGCYRNRPVLRLVGAIRD